MQTILLRFYIYLKCVYSQHAHKVLYAMLSAMHSHKKRPSLVHSARFWCLWCIINNYLLNTLKGKQITECCLEPSKSHGKSSKYSRRCQTFKNANWMTILQCWVQGPGAGATLHNELKMIGSGIQGAQKFRCTMHTQIHHCSTQNSKEINYVKLIYMK